MRYLNFFGWTLLFLVAVLGDDLSSEFPNSASLDGKSKVVLYWSVDWSESTVHFAVRAQTTGWVGFGFSSGQGKMKDADIVIGWVKDGKTYFSDRRGDGYSVPPKDESQDYTLTGSEEKDGNTTLMFKRKIDTCDRGDNKILEATNKLIFAYHSADPSSPDDIPKHEVKGARSVGLLNVKKAPKLPDNLKYFDIVNNQSKLPANDTTYWCSAFKIPEFSKKHHIVKVAPVIQKGHEGLVHHFVVYQCPNDFPPNNASHAGVCFSPDMPPEIMKCRGMSPIAAWAVGGSPLYLPENVGIPLGTDDSPKYVVMITHYDNPEEKAGIVDSSGIRFYYTENVREHDAGIFMTGSFTSPQLLIPPKQPEWKINGYCPAVCTEKALERTKQPAMNVVAVLLHTHLLGRAIRLRHVRNKVEQPEISRDDNYDFNFQEFNMLREEVKIRPGDELETVCTYDSTGRSNKATLGGESTRQEMCLSFLLYYPKANLSRCVSMDDGFDSFYRPHFGNFSRKDGRRKLENLDWTSEMVNELKTSYAQSKDVVAHCAGALGQRTFYGKLEKVSVDEPYKPEDVCSDPNPSGGVLTAVSSALTLLLPLLAGIL